MLDANPSRPVGETSPPSANPRQSRPPRTRPEVEFDLAREMWLAGKRVGTLGGGSDPGPTGSTTGIAYRTLLARFLDLLLPLPSSDGWTDAVTALRAWAEEGGDRGRPLPSGTGWRTGRTSPSDEGGGSGGQEPPAGLVPNQFDPSLAAREAYAACGPAAAVAFARAMGRDLSLRRAVDLAKTVGWTAGGGMNGVFNEKRLLETLGIPARLDTSGDWNPVVEAASAGSPVAISTPGHYFVADAYDPKTGRFHVGASGTSYRSGKEWMTRQEMESLAGHLNGALILDPQREWAV